MKRGFTLVELMILVMVIGVLAAVLYPGYNSIETRAQEAKVRANMNTVQIAVEEFATMTDGMYPQTFSITVSATNPSVQGNVLSVGGTAGATVAVAGSLLSTTMRNPVSKTIGWAFSSSPGAVPPAAAPMTVEPAVGAARDQGSVWYVSADASGAAAAVGNAKMYFIFGCGVYTTLPKPLMEKQ